MSNEKKCARCGETAETRDNIAETSFTGILRVRTETETIARRSVRFLASYIRYGRAGISISRVDEKRSLCSPCWGLLIGYFMQGRAVAPRDHEHEWKRGGRIGEYPMERCKLCMKDRIATTEGDPQ